MLSWEDTYLEMAASDEDWSDQDVTVNDGLDGDKMKAKIDKFAGIADKNLSTEEIMNLTREQFFNFVDSNVITFSLVSKLDSPPAHFIHMTGIGL